jgi:hypothetical protein
MAVIEMAAKLSFSFPVFFHVAILDNTPRGRYKAVHNLICGFDPDDKDNADVREYTVANGIVTGYINGNRPISEALTSRYLGIPREEQINHIRMVELQQPRLAANALVYLFKNGLIDMDPNDIERYLDLSNSEPAEEFLADMLTLAIKHRGKQPLYKATREMLVRIRDNLNANENAPMADSSEDEVLPGASAFTEETTVPEDAALPEASEDKPYVPELPSFMRNYESAGHDSQYSATSVTFASYDFRELEYERDRLEYRSCMIRIEGDVLETALSDEEIRQSTDLFRRADRTFFVDFTGTPAGLADVLLHRVSPRQCLQLVVISNMKSRKEFSKLRHMLADIVRFALADDGKMFFANSFDPQLPSGIYNIRVIYSIRQVSEDEKLRLDLALFPPRSGSLTPSRKYRGRVPDFLLPRSFDPRQSTDPDGN